MKNGIKSIFVVGLLLIASVFVATAHYGEEETTERTYERGTFHEDMIEIVENGSYEDLVAFKEENDGFGGPRWVTDEASFEAWKERHQENYNGEPGYMNKGGRGQGAGCPMRGLY